MKSFIVASISLRGFARIVFASIGIACLHSDLTASLAPADALLIIGAPGEPEYAEGFSEAAGKWSEIADTAGIPLAAIGLETEEDRPDRERALEWIASQDPDAATPLWIVYIGHGTYSRNAGARLNLRGPDLSADELATALNAVSRPVVFIHGGSASSPFINALSRPGRIIVTATQSPDEQNYARFGEAFSDAIADPATDADRDGRISILETFVAASNKVETLYQEQGRLATELALIDDVGAGKGLSREAFVSLRPTEAIARSFPTAGQLSRRTSFSPASDETSLTLDQQALRDELESQLDQLRSRKKDMDEDRYLFELEQLLRQLAVLYRADS